MCRGFIYNAPLPTIKYRTCLSLLLTPSALLLPRLLLTFALLLLLFTPSLLPLLSLFFNFPLALLALAHYPPPADCGNILTLALNQPVQHMPAWQSADFPISAVALPLSDCYFSSLEFEAACFLLSLHDGCLAILEVELVEHFGTELFSDWEEMWIPMGFVDLQVVQYGDGGLAGQIASSESLNEFAELSPQCLPIETCPQGCPDGIDELLFWLQIDCES